MDWRRQSSGPVWTLGIESFGGGRGLELELTRAVKGKVLYSKGPPVWRLLLYQKTRKEIRLFGKKKKTCLPRSGTSGGEFWVYTEAQVGIRF